MIQITPGPKWEYNDEGHIVFNLFCEIIGNYEIKQDIQWHQYMKGSAISRLLTGPEISRLGLRLDIQHNYTQTYYHGITEYSYKTFLTVPTNFTRLTCELFDVHHYQCGVGYPGDDSQHLSKPVVIQCKIFSYPKLQKNIIE